MRSEDWLPGRVRGSDDSGVLHGLTLAVAQPVAGRRCELSFSAQPRRSWRRQPWAEPHMLEGRLTALGTRLGRRPHIGLETGQRGGRSLRQRRALYSVAAPSSAAALCQDGCSTALGTQARHGRVPGREQDAVVVEAFKSFLRASLLLNDGELNSDGPGMSRTRATEVREQHEKEPTPPGSGETRRARRYTRDARESVSRKGRCPMGKAVRSVISACAALERNAMLERAWADPDADRARGAVCRPGVVRVHKLKAARSLIEAVRRPRQRHKRQRVNVPSRPAVAVLNARKATGRRSGAAFWVALSE